MAAQPPKKKPTGDGGTWVDLDTGKVVDVAPVHGRQIVAPGGEHDAVSQAMLSHYTDTA